MSKKSKRKRNSNPSNTQQEIGEKDMQNTDVKVHGAIEVHPSQDSKTLHNTEREEDTRQKGDEYSLSRWTFKVAVVALAISTIYSVFTLLIFIQTKKAANAAHDSATAAQNAVRQAERNMQIDQRAWLSVGTVAIVTPKSKKPEINQPLAVLITFRNTGKTPAIHAYSVHGHTWGHAPQPQVLDVCPEEDFSQPKFQQAKSYMGPISPGAELGAYTDLWVTQSLSKEQYDGIMANTLHLLVLGKVGYWDVFHREHWLTFGFHLLPSGAFAYCKNSNDIDEEK